MPNIIYKTIPQLLKVGDLYHYWKESYSCIINKQMAHTK